MDQDDDDLNFIRVETSPWEDVRKSWNNTFFSRMKFLNEYSTENYFNSFPCLKDEQGYELVSFFLFYLAITPCTKIQLSFSVLQVFIYSLQVLHHLVTFEL